MPRISDSNLKRFSPNQPAPELPNSGFVRLPTVLSVFPVSRASWWNGIKAGKFPKGVSLGPRTTAWKVQDIKDLIAATK
jgi:predicted DNA-binding transcriptional regulator AlpA